MSYVSARLRRLVAERAAHRCEYCLYPQQALFFTFEMEHIISEKHGGETSADNLALACPYCHRAKGTDLGSIDSETNLLVPFFNPRTHVWQQHLQLQEAEIIPLTPEGRVTCKILQFNTPDRLAERQRLVDADLYP